MVYPTGEQWTIRRGDDELSVVEVGGGLREWTRRGRAVLAGYAVGQECVAGRGQLLMPWPNRLRDGRYRVGGVERQLALSEPARSNASHGLVRWARWSLLDRGPGAVTVGCRLYPQQGWSWPLDLSAEYRLLDDGLEVTVGATNIGAEAAPFGFGAHPYLALGSTDAAEVRLTVPAGRSLDVDPDRMLPTGFSEVPGSALDFREPRALGRIELDTAFTDLTRGADGCWSVDLALDEGTVSVWGDEALPWVQVFTGRARPADPPRKPADSSRGIAVEPMSCPPDALRTGQDLVLIPVGGQWRARWGIRLHG